LAETEPGFCLNVHPFNYYAPDFSALAAPRGTLVYTASSIEQITEIGEDAIEKIAAIPGLGRVVHLEPVGWQLEEHTMEAAVSRQLTRFRKRTTRGAEILKYIEKRNYNRDLWPVLKKLESRGRIAIERVEKNILGINPFNPTTLIVWRPMARGG
jgi:hypothetical protein